MTRLPLSGRDHLLERIVAAWERAVQGEPHFLVIRGETGLGKTRLVQGFYDWLTTDRDPGGYWPPSLGWEGQSLRVNPQFEEKESTGEIPWLWLALRFPDPGGRNEVPGVQLSYVLDQLKPHLRPLLQFEARKRLGKSIALEAAGNIANVLSLNIPGAVLSIINLVEAVRAERSVAAAGRRGVASEVLAQRQELAQQLRDFFAAVLNPKVSGMRHVPIVLFLDDAHWSDSYTLSLVESLLADAVAGRWPLLIVCTHWEREWYEQLAASAGMSDVEAPQSVPHLAARDRASLVRWDTIDVPALDRQVLLSLAGTSLPGLAATQLAAIGEWVGGNPQLLEDLVALLRGNSRWFVDRNPANALTPDGERRLRSLLAQTSHHALNQSRFNVLPELLREVLALATAYGVRFVAGLVAEAARRMEGFEPAEVFAMIETAHRPLAILEPSSSSLREFRHRAMFDVARQRLETLYDAEQRAAFDGHVRDILTEWIASEAWGQLDTHAEEQLLALAVAVLDVQASESQRGWRVAHLRATLRLIAHYEQRALHSAARDAALRAALVVRELVGSGVRVDASMAFAIDLVAPAPLLVRAGRMQAAMDFLRVLDEHSALLFPEGPVRGLMQVQVASMAGVVAGQLRQPDDALTYTDRALEALAALETLSAANGTANADFLENVARQRVVLTNTRASILAAIGEDAEAWGCYGELIELLERRRDTQALAGQWTPVDAQLLGAVHVSRALLSIGRETASVALVDLDAATERFANVATPTDEQSFGIGMTLATRGVMHRKMGTPDAAALDFARSIETLESVAARRTPLYDWNPAAQLALAFAHLHRGILLREHGETEPAIVGFEKAVRLISELRTALEPVGAWTDEYSALERELFTCLARAQFERDDLQGALASYMRAGELAALESERGSDSAEFARAAISGGLATVYAGLGLMDQALGAADDAVAQRLSMSDRLEAGSPSEMTHRHNLAVTYLDRAGCYPPASTAPDRALGDVDRAIELLESLWGSANADPLLRHTCGISLGAAYETLGSMQAIAGDDASARSAYEAGISVLQTLGSSVPSGDPRRTLLHHRLSNLRERLGRLHEGKPRS